MKILVAAAGTGGHIYPALAIIDKFKEHHKDLDVVYVGTTNRMEKDIVPKLGIKYVGIEIYGLTKNIVRDIKNIRLILKDTKEMKKLMQEFKPDVVLGIGGYVTYPVIKAAHSLKIPVFIHEQNMIPGKVNKLTAKYADLIGVSFEESKKYFNGKNVFVSGNPVSDRALKIPAIKKSDLGLDEKKKLITIVSGSLGSSTINNKLKEYLKNIDKKDYQVLYITGDKFYEEYKKEKFPKNVILKPYVENLPGILKSTDLLITRAGASTIAEVIALNVVSIFIPSPYVANNHQYYNAMDLKNKQMAEVIEEKDLTAKNLEIKIDNILNDSLKYNIFKDNLKKANKIESSELIYQKIMECIKQNEGNM